MRGLRRAALRLVGTSALAIASALTLLPAGSGAEQPSVVGWWHRDVPLSDDGVEAQSSAPAVLAHISGGPAGASQVPPPPTPPPVPLPTVPPSVTVPDPGQDVPTPSAAPEGGLLVAADVTGARAMAALRFDVPDAGGAILTLTIATGSTPASGVRACPALSDWLPGPDQAWSRRPAHGCDRIAVSSSPSSDGTTMSWTLPDTFKDPESAYYDVLLVPPSGDGTPFQVAFEAPGVDAFTETSPAPMVEPYDSGAVDLGAPELDSTFGTDGFAVGDAGVSFPSQPVGTVQIQPAGNGRDEDGPLGALADALENPTTRRIATLGLILIGGYSYWQSGRTVERAPRLLGALAGPTRAVASALVHTPAGRPRGVGRFVRERAGPPQRL